MQCLIHSIPRGHDKPDKHNQGLDHGCKVGPPCGTGDPHGFKTQVTENQNPVNEDVEEGEDEPEEDEDVENFIGNRPSQYESQLRRTIANYSM